MLAVQGGELLVLSAFYIAFSPACFALLGLWLVAVQLRMPDWKGSAFHLRRSYGVALHFVLPGVMSLGALIDPHNSLFWRVCFAVVALGGAVVLVTVARVPRQQRSLPDETAASSLADRLEWGPFVLAAVLYVVVGALAIVGGLTVNRIEAFLLIALVFVGFNGAWLMLFDDTAGRAPAAARDRATYATATTPPPPGTTPEAQTP
jgi:hypothetical protein